MGCVTIFNGEGVNCNTGRGLGNTGAYRFDGYWVATANTVCGRSTLSPSNENGLHPNASFWAFYPPTLTVTYEGCNGNAPGYDCINGGCVPKSTYSTPGVFSTLAACTSGCAKNSNCTGECVSAQELAALQQAAGSLQSRICG
jgi:hypothetical protein